MSTQNQVNTRRPQEVTPEYSFSRDWFSSYAPTWDAMFDAIGWHSSHSPKKILEIGCFEGLSTIWMLKNLCQNNETQITCVDSFEGGIEHDGFDFESIQQRFTHNINVSGKAHQVRVKQGYSHEQLSALLTTEANSYDFIYVDGSHQAPDVLIDMSLSFLLLKPGGLMVLDDYMWTTEVDTEVDVLNNPKIAIDSFMNVMRRKIRPIGGIPNLQMAFVKV